MEEMKMEELIQFYNPSGLNAFCIAFLFYHLECWSHGDMEMEIGVESPRSFRKVRCRQDHSDS